MKDETPAPKRHASLRKKLLLLPLLFLAGLIVLQVANLYTNRQVSEKVVFPNFSEQAMNGYAVLLKATVDIEAATVAARVKGLQTREQQIAAIVEETDQIRFFADNSGYFFAYDLAGVRINVPVNKSGNGKSFLDATDPNGVRFVEELVKAGKAGGGYVEYSFEKAGQGVQPKLAYATLIPGTEFVLGTGVYIDNVEAELAHLRSDVEQRSRHYLKLTMILFAAVLLATVAASVWVSESTGRSIRAIILELSGGSEQITAAAGQVSGASQALAQGASEQASSLEETSASLEEMSSMTKRNADSATEANALARSARESADAGAGFAVVAEEVRALAQRSAQASKETADKIEGAIVKTAQGVQISDQVTRRLAEIVDKVRRVDALIAEVATASREQNQGVQQINVSIGQMDKVVQANAAGAEESAAAAEELNSQALSLDGVIANLSRLVGAVSKAK